MEDVPASQHTADQLTGIVNTNARKCHTPGEHEVQISASARENRPAAHVLHEDDPADDDVPAWQLTQNIKSDERKDTHRASTRCRPQHRQGKSALLHMCRMLQTLPSTLCLQSTCYFDGLVWQVLRVLLCMWRTTTLLPATSCLHNITDVTQLALVP